MIDFNIRVACLVLRAVVNDALTSVNETFVPEAFERSIYGLNNLLVQCKHEIIPACADAKGA
ncbi:hypothetical protein D3C72_1011710 [compost metagenome]